MSRNHANLAALVGSRLCHDLISPIGAIQNGLELLSLAGGDSQSPEMALIQDSCQNASARIRFFRVAFGHASMTQMMGQREVLSTLTAIGKGGKFTAEWNVGDDLPRSEVQLAFLAYLCCETALPYGGTIRFERDAAGWSIGASGPRMKVDEELWSLLNTPRPSEIPTADRVHFALLSILSEAQGHKILASLEDDRIAIKIA